MMGLAYIQVRGHGYSPELDEWQAHGIIEIIDEVTPWTAHRRSRDPNWYVSYSRSGELISLADHDEVVAEVGCEIAFAEPVAFGRVGGRCPAHRRPVEPAMTTSETP